MLIRQTINSEKPRITDNLYYAYEEKGLFLIKNQSKIIHININKYQYQLKKTSEISNHLFIPSLSKIS